MTEIAECVMQDNGVTTSKTEGSWDYHATLVSHGTRSEFHSEDVMKCAVGLWTFLIEIHAYSGFCSAAL